MARRQGSRQASNQAGSQAGSQAAQGERSRNSQVSGALCGRVRGLKCEVYQVEKDIIEIVF